MKKLKIYLDTSVVSYLDQPDRQERYRETHAFWEKLKAGAYELVMSDVTFRELYRCEDEKKNRLLKLLAEVTFITVSEDEAVVSLASKLIEFGILPQKCFDDCLHIAYAVTTDCDAIVSWNFKHIVNHKTIVGVKAIASLEGYHDLMIYTPAYLLGGENDDP